MGSTGFQARKFGIGFKHLCQLVDTRMGCCAARYESEDIEMVEGTNDAVCCRGGPCGDQVEVSQIGDSCSYNVTGSGTLVGSCCLDCDTAMWEVKIGKNPSGIAIGVKKFFKKNPANLNGQLDPTADPTSPAWFLSETELKEGDVVGVYWDQTDLPMVSFSVNGEMTRFNISRIRPSNDIYPAVSVQEGSSCEIVFSGKDFKFPPKSSKFQMIICASSLI